MPNAMSSVRIVVCVAIVASQTTRSYADFYVEISKLGIFAPVEQRQGPFATHDAARRWAQQYIESLPTSQARTYAIKEVSEGSSLVDPVSHQIRLLDERLKETRATAKAAGLATDMPNTGNVALGYSNATQLAAANAKAAKDGLTAFATDAPADALGAVEKLLGELNADEPNLFLLRQEIEIFKLEHGVTAKQSGEKKAALKILIESVTRAESEEDRQQFRLKIRQLVEYGELQEAMAADLAESETELALRNVQRKFDAIQKRVNDNKQELERQFELVRNPSPLINTDWFRVYDIGVDRHAEGYSIRPNGAVVILEHRSGWSSELATKMTDGIKATSESRMKMLLRPDDSVRNAEWKIEDGHLVIYVKAQYKPNGTVYESKYLPVQVGEFTYFDKIYSRGPYRDEQKKFKQFTYSP